LEFGGMERISIDPAIFEQVEKIVGSKETADDLWELFEYTMGEFDIEYDTYKPDFVAYLYMIFVFGFCNGHTQMPMIGFDDEDSGLH
jgi:hypothetical protein